MEGRNKTDIRVCSVQFCPVGDTVKAMVDADAPVLITEVCSGRSSSWAVLTSSLSECCSVGCYPPKIQK